MNRDEIIRLAREAGLQHEEAAEEFFSLHYTGIYLDDLERFAALVAAAEREACAEVLVGKIKRHEQIAQECALRGEYDEVTGLRSTARKLSECVAEIRARGKA